jgi:hypothetical protein
VGKSRHCGACGSSNHTPGGRRCRWSGCLSPLKHRNAQTLHPTVATVARVPKSKTRGRGQIMSDARCPIFPNVVYPRRSPCGASTVAQCKSIGRPVGAMACRLNPAGCAGRLTAGARCSSDRPLPFSMRDGPSASCDGGRTSRAAPEQRAALRTCGFLKVSLQEGTLHPVIFTYTSCLASLPLSEG